MACCILKFFLATNVRCLFFFIAVAFADVSSLEMNAGSFQAHQSNYGNCWTSQIKQVDKEKEKISAVHTNIDEYFNRLRSEGTATLVGDKLN